ncbi:hypothetical protein V493_07066 [Pseudogymnoascus sp. VKM F-4281 (FW-2241)]|nr:hypothetical protein V493_07066 [Pseudogymnoascus sp. VKM F-4281 (FW-2241)]
MPADRSTAAEDVAGEDGVGVALVFGVRGVGEELRHGGVVESEGAVLVVGRRVEGARWAKAKAAPRHAMWRVMAADSLESWLGRFATSGMVAVALMPRRSTKAAWTADLAGNPGPMFLGAYIGAGTALPRLTLKHDNEEFVAGDADSRHA